MAHSFYLVFSIIYDFFLPGYALTLLFCKNLVPLERFALSLGLSVIVIPLVSFSIAMLLGTFVKGLIVFCIATAISLIGGFSILFKKLKD